MTKQSEALGTCEQLTSVRHMQGEHRGFPCVNFQPVAAPVLGTCENYEDPRCAATHNHDPERCLNWKPVAEPRDAGMMGAHICKPGCNCGYSVAAPEKREDGWISVEQELPPDGIHVLIALCTVQVFVGHYQKYGSKNNHLGGWRMGLDRKVIQGVTHWRPLPAPPEASK